ncbi:hypothetical protein B0H21DRAFT_140058 [Amylocystis lapponica]|nr:hypothetical protein B0H21DRAFT_140058 [Amylocystis lapponica]
MESQPIHLKTDDDVQDQTSDPLPPPRSRHVYKSLHVLSESEVAELDAKLPAQLKATARAPSDCQPSTVMSTSLPLSVTLEQSASDVPPLLATTTHSSLPSLIAPSLHQTSKPHPQEMSCPPLPTSRQVPWRWIVVTPPTFAMAPVPAPTMALARSSAPALATNTQVPRRWIVVTPPTFAAAPEPAPTMALASTSAPVLAKSPPVVPVTSSNPMQVPASTTGTSAANRMCTMYSHRGPTTDAQQVILDAAFEENRRPSTEKLQELAHMLQWPPKSVKGWFSNKRNRKPASVNGKHRITAADVQILEARYAIEPYPSFETREALAKRLGWTTIRVATWFSKHRTNLELGLMK